MAAINTVFSVWMSETGGEKPPWIHRSADIYTAHLKSDEDERDNNWESNYEHKSATSPTSTKGQW